MTDSANNPYSPPSIDQPEPIPTNLGPAMAALEAAGQSGANWFFWIAGLSLVNTAITHSGGDRHFILGLSIPAIVDGVATAIGKEQPEMAGISMAIAIGFSVLIAAVVTAFGWLSRKRILWIFGTGMGLYLLDGLLYLLLGDFLSGGFHGYALYSMMQGFNAYRKMAQVEMAVADTTSGYLPPEGVGQFPQ